MVKNTCSSRDIVEEHTYALQRFLNSSAIGQPLDWTPPHNLPPTQIGFSCTHNRCIGVDRDIGGAVFPNNTCSGACPQLTSNEWLANKGFWAPSGSNEIVSTSTTILKKSIANSQVLPSWEILPVDRGVKCSLSTSELILGYYLCTYNQTQ